MPERQERCKRHYDEGDPYPTINREHECTCKPEPERQERVWTIWNKDRTWRGKVHDRPSVIGPEANGVEVVPLAALREVKTALEAEAPGLAYRLVCEALGDA